MQTKMNNNCILGNQYLCTLRAYNGTETSIKPKQNTWIPRVLEQQKQNHRYALFFSSCYFDSTMCVFVAFGRYFSVGRFETIGCGRSQKARSDRN